ncbi:cell envelope integrity protein CreD [Treponema parvum]|uniref:Cell envelope integrity protein CreD n=1 Tax=Treponema parvum TaxID=138851 RepID=A0A975F4I6_9SPIR|nr:cell envelope integrity protein CreD [Treponema parvum]QTQ14555.1 cell envelope integrity protein CreD [Treponema parvum]
MKKIEFSNSSIKIVLIFVLVLLFLIPLNLIRNLIYDRQDYQREAISSITRPLGGDAEIQGIVIAVPYKSYIENFDSNGNKHVETEIRYIIFAPDSYDLDISVNPYYLTRGIFKVPVFNGQIKLKADFSKFDFSYFNISPKDIMQNDCFLILGLSNSKNLMTQPKLNMDGKDLFISPIKYDSVSPFETSVYYNLSGVDFSGKINLYGAIDFQGGENIKIQPIASDNHINMVSSWPSPSFSGGWLPKERVLSKDGFSASWNIAGLSTVYPKSWQSEDDFNGETVDVSFIVPVDSYKKTNRSVKYALLFLAIPFIALLICEVFSKIRVHPIQYCLIGFADVIFYLLLLSISEHISFDLTYAICSICVCAATLLYASAILKKIKWGALLSAVQMISYIFLYGTLQAEDYALLIGSVGLFIVVILLMFITRKIDWYEINQKNGEPL